MILNQTPLMELKGLIPTNILEKRILRPNDVTYLLKQQIIQWSLPNYILYLSPNSVFWNEIQLDAIPSKYSFMVH